VSAGTIEMLLADSGEFFFLEMNTRLQVEHPVTEAVTGRDLVADQLRIAGGATLAELGLDQPPPIRGHAIEARLYAEDPESGFLPATGSLATLIWADGIRIDSGVRQGDVVTDRYDPMLAKLVAHGSSRAEALERLRVSLDGTTVLGVRTNLRFLRWLIDQPAMRDGEVRTDTITSLNLPAAPRLEERHWRAAAAIADAATSGPWTDGWRLNGPRVVRLRHGDEERSVALAPDRSEEVAAVATGDAIHVDVEGQSLELHRAPAPTVEEAVRHAAAGSGDGTAALVAPMPGRVIAVRAAEGAAVTAHQPIVVIEAMKMEHAVVAPVDGVLRSVAVTEGQQVQRGDLLAEVAQSDA
jgi:acetyl/propionyl-CoA carboxylase alpha subunit